MNYVIIPDIHADLNRLRATMTAAGFRPHGEGFRSETGAKALFLGDLIDNGPDNCAVIKAVRDTVEDGEGRCLMGNHELNALMMHAGFRERSDKNLAQHAAFLREYRFGDADTRDVLEWFSGLPIRMEVMTLETDERGRARTRRVFRAAHAFWGDDDLFARHTTRDGDVLETWLDPDLMPDLAAQSPGVASEILDVLKGPEVVLPRDGGYGFSDHYGKWRTEGRMRWWGREPETWADAMISLHGEHRLPPGRPSAEIISRSYPDDAPTLFIGHYKMKGVVAPISHNVVCLDFPDAEPFAVVDALTGRYEIRDAAADADLRP